jgi:tRNAThr (cytosine32-N3)-methyltransferase
MYPCPSHGKGKIKAAVWDITSTPSSLADALNVDSRPPASTYHLPEGLEPGSVDVLTVIYVLSALHPREWEQAIHNLYTVRSAAPGPLPYVV